MAEEPAGRGLEGEAGPGRQARLAAGGSGPLPEGPARCRRVRPAAGGSGPLPEFRAAARGVVAGGGKGEGCGWQGGKGGEGG